MDMPETLPPEIAKIQRVIEFREELPQKPQFTEPTTQKLRINVRKLYKAFLQLYDFALANVFLPYERGVEMFLNAAADNLVEFLRTGKARPIPREWMTAVNTMHVYGEKVVVAMANQLADPDETVGLFRQQFAQAFPFRRRGLTNTDEAIADYLRMWLEGMALQDVADEYMQDHFPRLRDPQSEGYKHEKRRVENMLEHGLRRAWGRVNVLLEDKK